ncbi:MAG: hypothetical protein KatS3mg035_0516 [Bacteroidia bacterium]|nr:MAG: hypothetical protein KatS3mg035_0516 [Bacteroidia bacterium]
MKKGFLVFYFFLYFFKTFAQDLKQVPGTYVFHEHQNNAYQIIVIDKNLNFWFTDGKKPFVALKTISADWKKNHLMLQFPNSKDIYHVDYEFEPIHSFEWINPDKSIQSFFYKDIESNPQKIDIQNYITKLKKENGELQGK